MGALRHAIPRGGSIDPRSIVATAAMQKAAHDIRTPLATVVQSVDALLELDGDTSERAERIFEILRRSVSWMGEVIGTSAARVRPPRQKVDMIALAEDVCALLEPVLTARRQTVSIAARPRSAEVFGDYGGIARALLNLLDNASKYGPREDNLRVTIRQRSAGTVVSVVDHGPGVPSGERHAIFRAFYRTEAARKSGFNGTGLGLTVVREVIEGHGGSVGVSRRQGATRAWFFLPRQSPSEVVEA